MAFSEGIDARKDNLMPVWHEPDPGRGPDLDGCAAAVEFFKIHFPGQPTRIIHQEIVPAVLANQAYYALSGPGEIEAIVAWAHLSSELHSQFLNGRRRLLDISEWNEGLNAWLMHAIPTKYEHLWPIVRTAKRLAREYGELHFGVLRNDAEYVYHLEFRDNRIVLRKILVTGGES